MANNISIPPSDLLIDEENPRLMQPNSGQREALRGIATDQQRKLVVLARDILEFGLSPAELPIVMPRGDAHNRLVVLAIRVYRALNVLFGVVNEFVNERRVKSAISA